MEWWQLVLVAFMGLAVGWLSGVPYKSTDKNSTSRMVINLILGAAGGLLGGFLFWLMQKLLVGPIVGYLVMAAVGAIVILWLLSRVKSTDNGSKA